MARSAFPEPQSHHLADGCLLALMRRKLAMLAATIAERHDAAEIAAPRLLISLDLSDPLTNAIALGLRESCCDG